MSGGDAAGISSPSQTERSTNAERRADAHGTPSTEVPSAPLATEAITDSQSVARHGLPSSVIHELRTPLTSIHGYAQVLQRTLRNEPRAANAIAVMTRESARLSDMLSQLSELSELESGEDASPPIEVEVSQIIEGIVHEVTRRDAGAHPIAVDGTAMARCNPALLSQAFLHVLTNAVRYSEAGQPIGVNIGQTDDGVEILVHDAGMSIDPADAERIFAPFERGANAREAGIRGLGLGLYLARQALAQTGGRLSYTPRATAGTTFVIELPTPGGP